tara:strand:+ start:264945 stop:266492 length:1548 start_codon:yes stop_codon:yes gene_type:complete
LELAVAWKKLLYRHLKGRAEPLFLFPEQAASAAALWMGVRLWMQRWETGDPIVFSGLPAGPEYIEVLAATLARQGTFIAGHPERGAGFLLNEVQSWQPDYVVLPRGSDLEVPGYRVCEEVNEHRNAVLLGRRPGYEDLQINHPLRRRLANTDRRIVLATSGTSGGNAKWSILSDRNLFSVLRTHIPALGIRKRTTLSVLPWNHAFGLVLDLLPSLFGARTVVRDNPSSMQRFGHLQDRFSIDYMSAVPALLERWFASDSVQRIHKFKGGLLGGAPINVELAERLRGSRFRVGYGQTEASPGVTLGQPGQFHEGFLGKARGCEVRLQDGQLEYRGPNVCSALVSFPGTISEQPGSKSLSQSLRETIQSRMEALDNSMTLRSADQWQRTGDIAELHDAGFVFLGREDYNFKLSNGRFLDVIHLERQLSDSTGHRCFVVPLNGGMQIFVVAEDSSDRDSILSSPEMRAEMETRLREQLGRLSGYIRTIHVIPSSRLPLNAKGIVLRSELPAIREVSYA